jgi:D-3-phosphoglycerate dehydrogenase
MKPTIYIAEPETINLDLIRPGLEAAGYELVIGSPDFSGPDTAGCQAIFIRSQVTVGPDILTAFPRLTAVIRAGTGLDNIDVEFCKTHGIAIYSSPGANAEAVSEYTVMMMLVALRKLNTLTPDDAASWNRFKFRGRSLKGQTIGIIGFGAIGRLIHAKLRGFNPAGFYAFDPYLTQVDMPDGVTLTSLKDVIEKADIITLHVPLTDETRYLIDRDELNRMRPGAILLNASRGGIVNEQAVAEMVRTKNMIYVADTVENEPQVSGVLLGSDNIIVTPHIASLSAEAEEAMVQVAAGNFLAGKPTVMPLK